MVFGVLIIHVVLQSNTFLKIILGRLVEWNFEWALYTIPLHHRYSKGLIALIVRCLEPDPDTRPSSFQVLHDLDKLLGETTFDHGKNNSVNNVSNIGLGKVSPKQLFESSSENENNQFESISRMSEMVIVRSIAVAKEIKC